MQNELFSFSLAATMLIWMHRTHWQLARGMHHATTHNDGRDAVTMTQT
jgi:hypothetical protein